MHGLKVNPAALHTTIEELTGALAEIEAEFSRLTSQLNDLSGSWSGAAADAYHFAQSEWNSSLADSRTDLMAFIQALSVIVANYEYTERTVIQECT